MEFRKLISFGKTSFIISVPKSWVLKNDLEKGSLVSLEEKDNNIIISSKTDQKEKEQEEISIDITGIDRTSIITIIRGLYRRGFDIIKLKFDNPVCDHFATGEQKKVISVIYEEITRLPGLEVVSQKDKSCTLKSISKIPTSEFETILRRIFILLNDASNDLVEGIKTNNRILLESIEEKHTTITKFASYCLRLINQDNSKSIKKSFFLYHTIATLDKITDIIKYASRDALNSKGKFKKETVQALSIIDKSIRSYYELFYKFNISKLNDFEKNRNEFKNLLNSSKSSLSTDELSLLNSVKEIIELLLDLKEAKISIEF